jgi:hypothetical protein
MHPDDLRAFARRDWDAAARNKQQYWVDRYRREGSGPARRASTLLLEHARRLGVGLFDDRHRADDVAQHCAMRNRLDRAYRALAGR